MVTLTALLVQTSVLLPPAVTLTVYLPLSLGAQSVRLLSVPVICLIELANVDLENGTFKGGIKTEAGEDRVVPIHSKIRYLVERHYNKAKEFASPYLFNCKDKRSGKTVMMSYQRYKAGFEMIRDELNLNPEHRPHDGRKHFVTAAKKAGIDEYAIKYMVGHKISDITEKVYTQQEFDWLKEEIDKIVCILCRNVDVETI